MTLPDDGIPAPSLQPKGTKERKKGASLVAVLDTTTWWAAQQGINGADYWMKESNNGLHCHLSSYCRQSGHDGSIKDGLVTDWIGGSDVIARPPDGIPKST